MSDEDASVLSKAGDVVEVIEVAQNALSNDKKKTQAAVEALLLTRKMARQTQE